MSSKTLGARPNWHTSVDLHEKPPDIDLNFSLMLTFFLEEQDFYKGSRLFFLSLCLDNSNIGNLSGTGIPQVLTFFPGALNLIGYPSSACRAPFSYVSLYWKHILRAEIQKGGFIRIQKH